MSLLWVTLIDDARRGWRYIEALLPPGADLKTGLAEAKDLACAMDCDVEMEINGHRIWVLPTTDIDTHARLICDLVHRDSAGGHAMSPTCTAIRRAWFAPFTGRLDTLTKAEWRRRLATFRDPQVQEAERALVRHLVADDAPAAQAALETWRLIYRQALARVRMEEPS